MKNKNSVTYFALFGLLFATLLILNLVLAQETPGLPSGLQKDPSELIEEYKNKTETSGEYLKQEWRNILTKGKYSGPIFSFIDNTFNFFNPFFKLVLGVEYSLSWAFIFAISIWIILFFFLYQPAEAIFSNKKLFGLIGAFVIASLVGLSGVIKGAVDLLSTIITQKWLIYVSLLLTILIGIVIVKFGGGLKEIIKKEKEKQEEEKEKQSRKILSIGAETVKDELKGSKE